MSYQFKGRHHDEYPNPWHTIQVKNVYENPWIKVEHRDVINPSGGLGIYGFVHFKNTAIGVVPLDNQGNTWIVGQYRYTLGRYSWEIPEGGGLVDADPLESAKRELLEETGISALRWTPLLEMHTSNSVTDEYGIVYVAQELSYGKPNPEETEQLQVRRLPFREVFDMVMRGDITDSLSMIAILKVNECINRGAFTF